jgi:RHS repeat-associated protein
MDSADQATSRSEGEQRLAAPSISLPKGGGAIRGIGEKFAANPVTGTGSMTVPLAASPGRSGFGPQLSLSYDSGAGNGPFGFGWSLSLPAITRKTDKGLPLYRDGEESDVYLLAGSEDLVPVLKADGTRFEDTISAPGYSIHRYRPRTEGLFARIERWTETATGAIHWRSITRDNISTEYGTTAPCRIADPDDPTHVFSWLICRSYDDKGNAIVYEYAGENDARVDRALPHERNHVRTANRYVKRIRYGNRSTRLLDPDLAAARWMFEVVFDYDEDHYEEIDLDPNLAEAEQHRFVRAAAAAAHDWAIRPDPFSQYRAGFEVRTYRRCRRVLMFHHFEELGSEPCLVRSTEFDYGDLDYSLPVPIDTELAFQGSTRFASFIRSVTQSGFVREESQPVVVHDGVEYVTYLKKSLPPVEFEYSKAAIQDEVRDVDPDSVENLPVGLDGTAYQWVDLDGEGVTGILTEQAGGWFYKPNRGGARFGPLETVASKPSLANLGGGRQQLLDLAGDGQLDLVDFAGSTPGFYERTQRLTQSPTKNLPQDWKPFRPFDSLPNIAWDEPNLRFVDLNGDGHADMLITEHELFTWYPSLAEDGFGPALNVRHPLDEERGPRLVLADGTQSIYLADMVGDGLVDIVRVCNGEVCYWPNLGYGRFGAKVTMDNAPWFDHPDQFDQRRIRLADIDGSGTNDILYLGRDEIRLYFNQSGNRLSEQRPVHRFPQWDNLSTVMAADLLGNGTACLVWSSPLAHDARAPMRYIDLMGGQKPHLLVRCVNTLGAETILQYASSTKFYLADKFAGRPWVTRIPFPVHVVERTTTFDRISGNLFVTRYTYHHGHFDGVEREFRGFGLVEQLDTEEFAALNADQHFPNPTNVAPPSHVPPALTRTWFHTGVFLGRNRVSRFFAGLLDGSDTGEYYREPGLTDAQAEELLLDDTVLPAGLTIDEEREACRALKGSMLRQEVYALDGTAGEPHPYTVTEQNFTVERLQTQAGNRHGIFFTHAREALSYHYERIPDDPRITHALTLEVDPFGNVLKSAAIAYGRRKPDAGLEPRDQARQSERLLTYTENDFTNFIDLANDYRGPLSCESRTFELTGLALPAAQSRFTFAQVAAAGPGAAAIAYEQAPTVGVLQKRTIERIRTLYRRNNLAGALPLGDLQSLALPFETYKLAFTPGLLADVYGGRVTDAMMSVDGGYVHSDGDAGWWIPSGRVFYSPDAADTEPQELAYARAHFFLPHRYRNPFHMNPVSTETFASYDANDLLIQETRDALGNRNTAGQRDGNPTQPLVRQGLDYRVLQPALLMEPNRNRSAVLFDALGMVVATALMGKPEDMPRLGDLLDNQEPDLTDSVISAHLQDPLANPQAILRQATTRLVYDLFAYFRTKNLPAPQPAAVYTLVRETHDSEPVPAGGLKIQHSFSYSDGFGREIQKKIQAEPGPVPRRDPAGKIRIGANGQPLMTPNDVSPRWVGSGWAVFNNKGKPVRQFEPFFTDTHRFESDVRVGVSPVLLYDPVERVVATLHPNHTWEKAVFGPWRQEAWDVSDTVLVADPKTDLDVGDLFALLPAADYLPTWHAQRAGSARGAREQDAANKAAVHAATPTVTHADANGRTFLTVNHNRYKYSNTPPADPPLEEFLRTRVTLDIEGNQRAVTDARDRVVMRYDYDMLGSRIHQASMEAGERWTLNDVTGKPLYTWDSRAHRLQTAFDPLRRPTDTLLRTGAGAPILVGRTVYGESRPTPETHNLRGKVVQLFDQAGVVESDDYDFKGNPLSSRRTLAAVYNATLDWSVAPPMEPDTYTSRTRFDALNRPTELTVPDQSVIRPRYNEANLLERVDVNLQGVQQNGQPVWTPFVTDIDYDAKGQRAAIAYGNGVVTTYTYDPLTFRLTSLVTARDSLAFPDDCRQPPPAGFPGCQVQSLHYTYDPVGNITHIRDDAQQIIYFQNKRVEPSADYLYDALYRLIEATGREHLGQAGAAPTPTSYNDKPRVGALFSANDGSAMARYLERCVYDAVGNFKEMAHLGTDPANPGWTRGYVYDETSQLEPLQKSNRLTRTSVGGTPEVYSVGGNGYDAHGNMLRMPHLQIIQWDFLDQLQMTQRQAVNATDDEGIQRQGERTYYTYDSSGQRVRKVTELAGGQRKDERIYLGGFEIYRRTGVNAVVRETLHIMDDKRRVALVETRTDGPALEQLIRYQFGNHLGSSSLELDDQARVISYEEYTPYGSTSYQAVRSQTETPKRYRYTDKERDEETGFTYHGARYCAPWLGRWTSCDPKGIVDGHNLFEYAHDNPPRYSDRTGTQCDPTNATCPQLMGNWSYGTRVPDRASLGQNVQRDHPIQVSLRAEQRGGAYNRSVSASRGELTVLAETGVGRFHTEVGRLQAEINSRVRAGIITSESQLIEETREAYRLAGEATGVTVNAQSLDRAIVSNLATLSETAQRTSSELHQAGVTPADFPTDASFDQAFSDPHAAASANSAPAAPVADVAPAAPAAQSAGGAATPQPASGASTLAEEHPSAPSVPAAPPVPPAGPGRFARAAAWSAEMAPKVLKVAGQVLTVYGAVNEANRTAELEQRNNRGWLNTGLMWTGTVVVGVLAGVVDDGLAAMATAASGSPAPVMDSWDQYGAGPVQHLGGEAIRGILDWGARHGF